MNNLNTFTFAKPGDIVLGFRVVTINPGKEPGLQADESEKMCVVENIEDDSIWTVSDETPLEEYAKRLSLSKKRSITVTGTIEAHRLDGTGIVWQHRSIIQLCGKSGHIYRVRLGEPRLTARRTDDTHFVVEGGGGFRF